MQLILHIGHAKTGTTSIQRTLHANRQGLLQQGVVYAPGEGISHNAVVALLGKGTSVPAHKEAHLRAQAAKDLQQMAATARSHGSDHVLISSEGLFALAREQMGRLLELLPLRFERIVVAAYLRRCSGLYISMTQQRLKSSHVITSPHEFRRDYLRFLQRWAEVAGRENVVLRPFDRSLLTGGDAVQDFLELLGDLTGIDANALSRPPGEANPGLTAEQMVVLQQFREEFLAGSRGSFHPASNRLVTFFQESGNAPSLEMHRPELRPELMELVDSRCHECNRELDVMFCGEVWARLHRDVPPAGPGARPAAVGGACHRVEELLAAVNPDAVEALRACIPAYAPDFARAAMPQDLRLCVAWARYLQQEGLEAQARQAALHAARLARELEVTDFANTMEMGAVLGRLAEALYRLGAPDEARRLLEGVGVLDSGSRLAGATAWSKATRAVRRLLRRSC